VPQYGAAKSAVSRTELDVVVGRGRDEGLLGGNALGGRKRWEAEGAGVLSKAELGTFGRQQRGGFSRGYHAEGGKCDDMCSKQMLRLKKIHVKLARQEDFHFAAQTVDYTTIVLFYKY